MGQVVFALRTSGEQVEMFAGMLEVLFELVSTATPLHGGCAVRRQAYEPGY